MCRTKEDMEAAYTLLSLQNIEQKPGKGAEMSNVAQATEAEMSIVTSTPRSGKRPLESFEGNQSKQLIIMPVNSCGQIDQSRIVRTPNPIIRKPKTFWLLTHTEQSEEPEEPTVEVINQEPVEASEAQQKVAVEVIKPEVKTAKKPKKPVAKKPDANASSPKASASQSSLVSKSGRIVKRTRRFISDDEVEPSKNLTKNEETIRAEEIQPAKKRKISASAPTPKKPEESLLEDVQPVKKIKILAPQPPVPPPVIKLPTNQIVKRKQINIFGKNVVKSMLHEKVRHSRYCEMTYEEKQHLVKGAKISAQYRAAEKLEQYKEVIENERDETLSKNSKVLNLISKFRHIGKRNQICDEFNSSFKVRTCNEWKPFEEDAKRKQQVAKEKSWQAVKKARIECLVQLFMYRKNSQALSQAILLKMLKYLPERPEVRHEFFTIHLPKLIAAKQATKKKRTTKTKLQQQQVNPAYKIYF